MAKFKDPDTEEIIEIVEFKTTYTGGESIYKEVKSGKQLVNKNGKPLEFIPVEKDWSDPDALPTFLTFGSKSAEEKKKILTKRSKDKSIQTNREYKDKRDFMDGKGEAKPKKKTNFPVTKSKKK